MNEIDRERLIKQRYQDLKKDSDRLAEVVADYSDVIAAKIVKSKFELNNDIFDYLDLHIWDIAETEIDYENQSDSIEEAIRGLE